MINPKSISLTRKSKKWNGIDLIRLASQSLILVLVLTAATLPGSLFADQPNVLFIATDDLNDYISPLGSHPGINAPNFDRLAKRSVTFANAHCAAPDCHPSRVAMMTGVHPATSGIYRNLFGAHGPRWRDESSVFKNAVVLSQHFRNNEYRAVGGVKINWRCRDCERRRSPAYRQSNCRCPARAVVLPCF